MKLNYTKGGVTRRNGYWRLTIDVIDEDGARRRKTKMTRIKAVEGSNAGERMARTELRRWRDQLIAEERSAEEPADEESVTLSDYARAYLARHRVADVTREKYETTVRNFAFLGAKPLRSITSADIEDWQAQRLDEGVSQVTLAGEHAFLAQVIKYAVAAGDLDRSPLGLVKAPKKTPKPVNCFTQEQAREVMRVLESMGTSAVPVAARIALMTGMRRSEICALRWRDVDFTGQTVSVVHALTRVKGGFVLSTPKDVSGRGATRTVPLAPALADLLLDVRRGQRDAAAARKRRWSSDYFVLGNERGEWKSPSKVTNEWRLLAQMQGWRGTQGERVTFHDLRHTFATIAIAQGTDVMSLASILGHRDASMTLNIYALALAEPKRNTIAAVNDFYA